MVGHERGTTRRGYDGNGAQVNQQLGGGGGTVGGTFSCDRRTTADGGDGVDVGHTGGLGLVAPLSQSHGRLNN